MYPLVTDGATFTSDTKLLARHYIETCDLFVWNEHEAEYDDAGVARPRLDIIEGDSHFLDTTIVSFYIRVRGISVRTFFVSFPSDWLQGYSGTIHIVAQAQSDDERFEFDISQGTNQATENGGFGEYVMTHPGEKYKISLSILH